MKKSTKVILGCVAAVLGVNAAGVASLSAASSKKMNENAEGNSNVMYSTALGTKKVDINPDIDHAFINCVTGVTEVNLNERPEKDDLYIEIGAICSVIAISLPSNVRVSLEGEGTHEAINYLYPTDYDEEDTDNLPTVHVVRNTSLCTTLVVKENKKAEC